MTVYKMFNPDADFLALDFDGVIVDSIGECLVMGHNAYGKYTRSGAQIRRLEEMNESSRLRLANDIHKF